MMAPNYDKKALESKKNYLKKAREHIGRNVVQITMKMRTIVRITQIILLLYSIVYKRQNLCRSEIY